MAWICVSFLLWGLLRSLNDLLVNAFRTGLTLHFATAMLLHTAFFLAYVITCIPAGRMIERYGHRWGLGLAVIVLTLGAALCAIAVVHNSFNGCFPGVFAIGVGVAALQTAGNSAVSTFGAASDTARRLLFAQSFQALGAMTSPLLFARLPRWFTGVGARSDPPRLIPLYALSFVIGVLLLLSVRRAIPLHPVMLRRSEGSWTSLLTRRRVVVGFVISFAFIGVEATVLAHAVPLLLASSRRIWLEPTDVLAVYWGAVLTGRVLSVRLLRSVPLMTLLRLAGVVGLTLVVASVLLRASVGGALVLATGLCNAVVFPAAYAFAVETASPMEGPMISAIFSTALCGGAIFPLVAGLLVDRSNVSAMLVVPAVVYLGIACFAGRALGGRVPEATAPAIAVH
ncbi:MFS transporter [Bryocella elongata]|nr:MFS transporter [Bryocella elongata]